MIKKKIILTFDYELFLGRDSGTIEKCMLEPTNKILYFFKKHSAKGLFFIDATCLTVLKKEYNEGYLRVKQQILDILVSGSDIGFHIHPHWLDSYKIDYNRFSFKKYDNFRIHNLNKISKTKLILESFNELNMIVKEYDKNYKIDSFRAGGWSVQPFSFLKYDLKSIGIKYDFSVLPGMKYSNIPKHYYDFTEAINYKSHWSFADDVLVEDLKGSFIEIPSTVINMSLYDLFKLKKQLKSHGAIGDGKAAYESNLIDKLKRVRPSIKQVLSSDCLSLHMFKKYTDNLNKDFLVHVAHPKSFSMESFNVLEYILLNYSCYDYKSIS